MSDESHDMISLLSSKTFEDVESFEKAISLGHEVNHYMQDLSINACITAGHFRDYLTAYARELSKIDGVKFPLNSEEAKDFNHSLRLSEEEQELLTSAEEVNDVYRYLFVQKHIKPETKEYEYKSPIERHFVENKICFDDLLESYAYNKSCWDYIWYNQEGKGAGVLKEVLKKVGFIPLKYRDGKIVIEDRKRELDYVYPYQIVRLLVTLAVPLGTLQEYLDYCEHEMPFNYMASPAKIMDACMKTILETALCIPGFGFIMGAIQNNTYDKEVFSPVHRFYKIIKTIRDNGGCPNSVEGEDYMETFFNFVADRNHWPSYEETFKSMVSALIPRAKQNGEVWSAYQLNAICNKKSNYRVYAQDIPYNLLNKWCLPLVLGNEKGLFVNESFGSGFHWNPSGLIDFYHTYFCKEIKKHEYCCTAANIQEALARCSDNHQGAVREIICRLFSNAVYRAYFNKGKYECPFYKNGCPYSTSECRCFSDFRDVIGNCKKSILRLPNVQMLLDNEEGNFPDCMFLNYLYDCGFNKKKQQT